MKRTMYYFLIGLGILTLVTGIYMAVGDPAEWVSRVHVIGAGIFTLSMVGHVWARRKTVSRVARSGA